MASATDRALRREVSGLIVIFTIQLMALLALCLTAAALVAAVALFLLSVGRTLSEDMLWPVITAALTLGGVVIALLAWRVARWLGARRAKASPQFKTRRSAMGALQLVLPPAIYLLFAYIWFIA